MGTSDVVVIGAGNAALCAALSALDADANVRIFEWAPYTERGGNSYYTGGGFRFPYDGVADICGLLSTLGEETLDDIVLEPYTREQYFDDMGRMTHYRCDPDLVEALIHGSREALTWLDSKGVRFVWSRGRHAHLVDGKFHFWGNVPIDVSGGGAGLVDQLFAAAESSRIKIAYESRMTDLLVNDGAVQGVRLETPEGIREVETRAVVLACGGFEANEEWRARYLGPNWDLARVRGTRFNTGDGHRAALAIGARPYGHWSGCHATAWDANAPHISDRRYGDRFSRHSYSLGILVNSRCERFVDEGEDIPSFTFAKVGAALLEQPGIQAFQIFDDKVIRFCRDGYRGKECSRLVANTLEELAAGLELDVAAFVRTVEEFNAAVQTGVFDPNVKDGKRTQGLDVDKTNWAQPLDTPPYYGYPVTTGITFTFGGLRIDSQARVLDWADRPIQGLFAAGEIVGGLFYHNYPAATGLTSGTVFGRIAGLTAAAQLGAAASTR